MGQREVAIRSGPNVACWGTTAGSQCTLNREVGVRYFGTDGVRGVAGVDLTADLAYRLGRAAGLAFRPEIGRAHV